MRKILLLLLTLVTHNIFALTGLEVNSKAPNLELITTQGKKINFNELKEPTIVVFYRGAWCPYCMGQLKKIQSELMNQNKFQVLAISVDKKSIAKKMKDKFNFTFNVISDPKAKSLKAFNIINKINDDLVKKYKDSYKIDIEADSGEKHHMVAHPAVFIIKDKKIIFSDVHIDYKQRTKNSDILKVMKTIN